MGRRLRTPIILGIGLFAALAAAAAFSSASVLFRSAQRDGKRVAEVLIGDRVVIVLRTSAGGYTPLERAEIVANRLRAAMGEEIEADDVLVGPVLSGHGVFIRAAMIVSAQPPEAEAHGATTEALARLWRDNILLALGLEVPEEPPAEEEQPPAGEAPTPEQAEGTAPGVAEPAGAEEPTPTAEVDWTGAAQKWVPIFSLESEGVYLGAAQVAGPRSQVEKVKGVAELRLNFRNIGRVYAYIPVSTISLTKLDRVQGVSVWATGDIKLVNF